MTYHLPFRIRKIYYDQVFAGVKTEEYRKASPFWVHRAARTKEALEKGETVIGVFLCGKDVHRRAVIGTSMYASAEEALGRDPSDQGAVDLGPGYVFGFHLGEVVI
jgi:hypothetical protein